MLEEKNGLLEDAQGDAHWQILSRHKIMTDSQISGVKENFTLADIVFCSLDFTVKGSPEAGKHGKWSLNSSPRTCWCLERAEI